MRPTLQQIHEQQKKLLSRRQLMQRKRSRKMRHGRKNVIVIGGKLRRITPKQRIAYRKAGQRLRRLSHRPSIRRKAARTRMRYDRLRGVSHTPKHESAGFSVEHSPEFVHAVIEFVRQTGAAAVGADLLEGISADLTSTPIGVYTMDVCEKIEKMSNIGKHFVDAMVIDEYTSVFFFVKNEDLTETAVQALGAYGIATVLAKPGDAVNDDEVSELYVVSLEVSPDAIAQMSESHEGADPTYEDFAEVLADLATAFA
jgi:hypothetical protein